jgi:hypothetical protein
VLDGNRGRGKTLHAISELAALGVKVVSEHVTPVFGEAFGRMTATVRGVKVACSERHETMAEGLWDLLADAKAVMPPVGNVDEVLGDHDALDVRAAAAEYHGGMCSALYALSSTGSLVFGIRKELADALALASDNDDNENAAAFELLAAALNS